MQLFYNIKMKAISLSIICLLGLVTTSNGVAIDEAHRARHRIGHRASHRLRHRIRGDETD